MYILIEKETTSKANSSKINGFFYKRSSAFPSRCSHSNINMRLKETKTLVKFKFDGSRVHYADYVVVCSELKRTILF